MRKIKFRAYIPDTGEMAYTDTESVGWDGKTPHCWIMDSGFPEVIVYELIDYISGGEPEQKEEYLNRKQVLMQYTGLKDKNGKEIYGEDILRNPDTGEISVVIFENGSFWAKYEHKTILLAECLGNLATKVGNIYENPELLKEATNA